MELRGRLLPDRWPMPPIRDPLEMQASLLGSDAQGLLGTEELAENELTSSPQLQWGTHTEFPSVVRFFELNCHAISLTVVAGGGIFSMPTRAVAGLDLGTRGGDVDVPIIGGP